MIESSQGVRSVVVASPLPPPATGVEMLTLAFLRAPWGPGLHVCGGFPSRQRPAKEKGAFSLRNILKTLVDAALLWSWLDREPRPVVVTNLVQNAGGLLRYGLFIWICRARRVPVVAVSHGDGFARFLDAAPGWVRRWVRLTLPRIDRVLLHAPSLSRQYGSLVEPDAFAVVPPGIASPEGIERRVPSGRARICFIGYLTRAKGAHDLIRAALEILAIRDVEFHFIGDQIPIERNISYIRGPRDNSVELAALLGDRPDPRLIFHGTLDDAQKWKVLAASDIFTLPSHSEALPVSLLEALACGLPVVMTPVGGIPEVIRNEVEGLFVPPGDPAGLKAAIVRLIDDPELRVRMGQAGRRLYVERHTLEGYAARLRVVLERLCP